MKKNDYVTWDWYILRLQKLIKLMKLTVFFILISVASLFASNSYSQSKTLNLNMKNTTIKEVLHNIEAQSEFYFMYSEKIVDVNREISINVSDKKIAEVLDELFEGTNVNYNVKDRFILLATPEISGEDKTVSQQKIVRGKVTDENGEFLPGVTVVVKGTSKGTVTDIDGAYTLGNVPEDAILVFSFVGMRTQEIKVGTQSSIDVKLSFDAIGLEEVIAVGYGVQKKETLTGSVVNVSGEELLKTPSANVSANLQGKLPGLTSNQRSGEPGRDDPTIRIRGLGTMNDNDPLIIIDGVPRDNMSRLNPDDIESVSVLKDASAAIYGARAANGVILVTTKAAKAGKPVFNFSIDHTWSTPAFVPDMLGSPLYAETYNEGEWYDQGRPDDADFNPYYSDAEIQKFTDGSDPILYPNTDWMGEVLKNSSSQKRVSFSAQGGSEKVRYLLSFAYMDQDGNFKNNPTRYRQYNVRTKIDANLTENLTVGANISAIIKDGDYSQVGTWVNFYNIMRSIPTLAAVYPNGMIAPGRFAQNPLLNDRMGYTYEDETPIYSTFTASYKVPFIEGLKIDASFNYDLDNQTYKNWDTPYTYHEYNVTTGEYDVGYSEQTSATLTSKFEKYTQMMYNYRISYEKQFEDHKLSAMIGQEQQRNTYSWVSAYRKNYVSSAIDEINVGSTSADDKDNGGSSSESAYNNFFGRLNYDYKSKYLVEFVFRYDGSQIFPEGERYGFFPAVSAGWRLSEENFIKDNLTMVDQLKLRFSAGQIGNDNVNQWQYLQSYSFGSNYVFGTTDVPGVYANTLPNANITWETATKTDIGIDATLWNHLLDMEFTLWWENRSDILTSRNLSVPEIAGLPDLPDENIGEVDANGFEFVISHRNMNNAIKYFLDANIAYATSSVVYMDETIVEGLEYQSQTGKPIGSSLYYKTDGIFNTQDELDANPHRSASGLGDIKIIDVNEDGSIDGEDQVRWDKTVTPEWVFGFTAGMEYKNFDLNLFFQGQAGAVNYFTRFEDLGTTEPANAFVERAKDRWTVDNPNGTMPRARHDNPGDNDFFLYDATFVRLKNAELGYTLPKNIASKIHVNDVRFYVSGSNLLTWAKEIDFTDPETSGQSINYPPLRAINLGINVKF